ncbi:MAG TPA: cupin domain-containing protein [Candidatus Woesebacteria bacterium]|nr:cupin domain-containing protein [Candidatus Woesebacteria bacterium]HNS94366.1 cupin domain-containing protein [Candidatus Woesebacteria bacterium]
MQLQRCKIANFAQFHTSHNGWIVGAFYEPGSIQYSGDLEIRHGIIEGREFIFSPHYHTQRTSYLLVVKGEIVMKFDGQQVTVSAGQFAIFLPGVTEEGISAKPGTELLIIRTPSSPKEDKVEIVPHQTSVRTLPLQRI